MAVRNTMKRPSRQPNVAKPKKEAVGKARKTSDKERKVSQPEEKRSARIQNRIKNEPKSDVKNVKSVKSPPKSKSPSKANSSPQKETSSTITTSPTQNRRSARRGASSVKSVDQVKNLEKKSRTLSNDGKSKNVAGAKNAKNQEARKIDPSAEASTKSADSKTLTKPSKSVTTRSGGDKKAGKNDSKAPSVSSKLQKKKRKSVKSPLKKKLEGKVIKTKKSPLLKKSLLVTGSAKKKPSKSQLKLAVEQNRGVVYFSHLPHGFYENELKEYCGQFGVVTGVHVPRSVNGKSKGFAFVEFKHPEVAEVVAETMNNYLMHTRLLKAELVPLERQKPWIFRNGANAVQLAKKKKADALAARTRKLTAEEEEAQKKKAMARVNRLKKKLSEKGINLDFTVVS